MTEIDFYLLNQKVLQQAGAFDARIIFTARLCQKIFSLGQQIFICTIDQQQSSELSAALWQQNPESFLAHQIIDSQNPPDTLLPNAIKISHNICHHSAPILENDLLINLTMEVPDIFSRFKRTVEIVSDDEEIKNNKREHWKFYQHRGYKLRKHDISH